MPWIVRFLQPIVPTKGQPIVTLADARKYLLAIPETDQNEAVESAIEAVTMAAEGRGALQHAQVSMRKLVYGPTPISVPSGTRSTRGTLRR
jgi:hypothetical protein